MYKRQAHNGTISNVEELSNMVGGCSFTPQHASDTLVVAQRLVSLISEKGNLGKALSILKSDMVGSYCFTFLSDDSSVFAARDPKGFRPMVMGEKVDGKTHIIASESSALSAIGAKLERDIIPGELIKLSKNGIETEMFSTETSRAHCSFEFTYFAHPSSKMEGSNIYTAEKISADFLQKNFHSKMRI